MKNEKVQCLSHKLGQHKKTVITINGPSESGSKENNDKFRTQLKKKARVKTNKADAFKSRVEKDI